jgi:hypothetical protein
MVPNSDASVAAIAKLLGISPSTPTPRGDNPDGRTAPVSIPSIGGQRGESSPVRLVRRTRVDQPIHALLGRVGLLQGHPDIGEGSVFSPWATER